LPSSWRKRGWQWCGPKSRNRPESLFLFYFLPIWVKEIPAIFFAKITLLLQDKLFVFLLRQVSKLERSKANKVNSSKVANSKPERSKASFNREISKLWLVYSQFLRGWAKFSLRISAPET
jgi:hypothetical protein